MQNSKPDYKAKTFLWNEKGFSALNHSLESLIRRENITFEESFREKNVGKVIVYQGIVKGKLSPMETAIQYLVENDLHGFLTGDSPFCSIGFTQHMVNDQYVALTGIAFSKNP